jgi:hypothetical protein
VTEPISDAELREYVAMRLKVSQESWAAGGAAHRWAAILKALDRLKAAERTVARQRRRRA